MGRGDKSGLGSRAEFTVGRTKMPSVAGERRKDLGSDRFSEASSQKGYFLAVSLSQSHRKIKLLGIGGDLIDVH